MKKRKFRVADGYRVGDKRVPIIGPDDFYIMVDVDDCDTAAVAAHLQKMLWILETHWDDDAYVAFGPPDMPQDLGDTEAYDKAIDARYEHGLGVLAALAKQK